MTQTQTQEELTRDSLIKYRELGLSYQEIADTLGKPWSYGKIYRRAMR